MTYNEARACKTASQLPQEYQDQLAKMRSELKDENTPFAITLHSKNGRVAFYARRCQHAWENHRTGNRLNFGGGSYWTIVCCPIQWRPRKDLMGGGFSLELCDGPRYGKYGKDDKAIPRQLATKKEVLELAREIGLFNI